MDRQILYPSSYYAYKTEELLEVHRSTYINYLQKKFDIFLICYKYLITFIYVNQIQSTWKKYERLTKVESRYARQISTTNCIHPGVMLVCTIVANWLLHLTNAANWYCLKSKFRIVNGKSIVLDKISMQVSACSIIWKILYICICIYVYIQRKEIGT